MSWVEPPALVERPDISEGSRPLTGVWCICWGAVTVGDLDSVQQCHLSEEVVVGAAEHEPFQEFDL
ncbi:hypothetical protein, partial [Nonomuraea basaltis]|uniref:hypothetical protein n=1 Tax=Nonomuraea basaltis TaxID=2495887 RepID=UPI00197DEF3F